MANIFGNGLIGRVDVNWIQTSGFYWDENHMKVFYTTTTRSDDRCYYLKDHLGSNRMTINSLGVVTNVQDFYAYGEVLRSYNNSTPNEKYKFTGKERDTETDLDYFGARYYDSELGRWLSIDPLAAKYPQWSPYVYCLNNPIRLIDIKGMYSAENGDGSESDDSEAKKKMKEMKEKEEKKKEEKKKENSTNNNTQSNLFFHSAGLWTKDTQLKIKAGQVIVFNIKNINILPTTFIIENSYPLYGPTYSLYFLPLGSKSLTFSTWGSEPMTWVFDISTTSAAFSIDYSIQSTWVPGMAPNK